MQNRSMLIIVSLLFMLIFHHILFLQKKLKEKQMYIKKLFSADSLSIPQEIPLSSTFFTHFCNILAGGFDRDDIVVLGRDRGGDAAIRRVISEMNNFNRIAASSPPPYSPRLPVIPNPSTW
jgi:hypothetical protein